MTKADTPPIDKCLTTEAALAVSEFVVRTTFERLDATEKRATERLKPKEIAAELGISRQHVWRLVKAGSMPMDQDPAIGPCIQRAELERWRRNRTRSIEGLKAAHGRRGK